MRRSLPLLGLPVCSQAAESEDCRSVLPAAWHSPLRQLPVAQRSLLVSLQVSLLQAPGESQTAESKVRLSVRPSSMNRLLAAWHSLQSSGGSLQALLDAPVNVVWMEARSHAKNAVMTARSQLRKTEEGTKARSSHLFLAAES